MTDHHIIAPAAFESFAKVLLLADGAHETVAADVAWATTESTRCGVDTHGINLVPRILDRVKAGRSQLTKPGAIVTREGLAVAAIDGELAPGQHLCLLAAREAAKRAKAYGIGYVAVRNSTHFGGCVPFLRLLAREGLAGMVGSNSLRSMAAFGLERANLGNNPFGFVAPAEGRADFVFDASAAVMSFGRRRQLLDAGQPLPEEAWVTPAGPIEDLGVCEVADSLDQLAVPFGGFKGASVAVFVELLAGLVPGGHSGEATETTHDGSFRGPGHFVLAVDPAALDTKTFASDMAAYLDGLHRGSDSVRVPGERLAQVARERDHAGLAVSAALAEALRDHAARVSCPLPAELSS